MLAECRGILVHQFEVEPSDEVPICPVCGAGGYLIAPPRLEVRMAEGRHRVGDGNTWLGNKQKFVEMLQRHAPEMSETDIVRSVKRWFPMEKDNESS